MGRHHFQVNTTGHHWALNPKPRLYILYHLAVMSHTCTTYTLLKNMSSSLPLQTIIWLPEPNNYNLTIYVCVCVCVHAANLLVVGLAIHHRESALCGEANNSIPILTMWVPYLATGHLIHTLNALHTQHADAEQLLSMAHPPAIGSTSKGQVTQCPLTRRTHACT